MQVHLHPPNPSRFTSQLVPYTTLPSSICSCGNEGSRESGSRWSARVAIFLASKLVLVVVGGVWGGKYSPSNP